MKDDLARNKTIEKLIAGTLRAQSRARTSACLDAETLAAYVERTLAPSERLTCEAHLASCLNCQEQVAQLVRLSETDAPAQPPVTAVVRTPKVSWYRWAWAAPVVIAAALAGVWYKGEFRKSSKPLEEARLKAPPASQPALAPPAAQNIGQASSQPAARDANKTLPVEKQAATPAASPHPKPHGVIEAEPRGTLGKLQTLAPPADRLSAGAPTVAPQVRTEAIATPSERAQLAKSARLDGRRQAAAAAPANEPIGTEHAEAVVPPPEAFREDEKTAPAPAPPVAGQLKLEAESEPSPDESKTVKKGASGSVGTAPTSRVKSEEEISRQKAPAKVGAGKKDLGLALSGSYRTAPLSQDAEGGHASAGGPGVSAVSAASRWRAGPEGLIQKTDPSGKLVTVVSGVKADLFDIAFSSPSVGWVVGQAGTVLRTTDGGKTWVKVAIPTAEDLLHAKTSSDDAVIVTTRSGRTFATSDAGKSWTLIQQK